MNSRAQLIRRLAGDFVERCRRALSSSGDDAAQYVDRLDRSIAEDIAGDICSTLGVDYERTPEPRPLLTEPTTKAAAKTAAARKASPWRKRYAIDRSKPALADRDPK